MTIESIYNYIFSAIFSLTFLMKIYFDFLFFTFNPVVDTKDVLILRIFRKLLRVNDEKLNVMKQIRRKMTQTALLNLFRMCIRIKFIHDVCNIVSRYHFWYCEQTYIDISAFLYEKNVHNVTISVLNYRYMTYDYFAQTAVSWDDNFRKQKIFFFHFVRYSHSETLHERYSNLNAIIENLLTIIIFFQVRFVRLQWIIKTNHRFNISKVVFIEF